MTTVVCFYLWAGFWTSIIASRSTERPRNQMGLILGSLFLGLVWPISLPLHALVDLPDPNAASHSTPQEIAP